MNTSEQDFSDRPSGAAYVVQLRAFMEEQQLTPEQAALRFDVDIGTVHRLLQEPDPGAGLGLETLVCMVLAAGMPSPER